MVGNSEEKKGKKASKKCQARLIEVQKSVGTSVRSVSASELFFSENMCSISLVIVSDKTPSI